MSNLQSIKAPALTLHSIPPEVILGSVLPYLKSKELINFVTCNKDLMERLVGTTMQEDKEIRESKFIAFIFKFILNNYNIFKVNKECSTTDITLGFFPKTPSNIEKSNEILESSKGFIRLYLADKLSPRLIEELVLRYNSYKFSKNATVLQFSKPNVKQIECFIQNYDQNLADNIKKICLASNKSVTHDTIVLVKNKFKNIEFISINDTNIDLISTKALFEDKVEVFKEAPGNFKTRMSSIVRNMI